MTLKKYSMFNRVLLILFIMFRSRFFLIIMALTIYAGQMFGQKIHPDISSKTAKAVVDPSVIKGPIKPMNAVNNGPNVADYADQM